MIGIIGAMQVEVAKIREEMTDTQTQIISGMEFTRGKLFDKDIVVAVCGIGKVFAAMCTQTMIISYKPDIIINSGVAGTLTFSLSIGDIAIADRLVQHDMDTSAIGDPKGLISGINVIYFEADRDAAALISQINSNMGIKSLIGTIASGDVFVNDRDRKREIVSEFGAIACEMEGAAIAQVCYVNKTRFAVIRAISDDAGGEKHTQYDIFLNDTADKSIRILKEFIKIF